MRDKQTPTGISKSVLFISVLCFFHFIHFSISSFREAEKGVEHRPRSQIDTRYAGVNDGFPFPRRLGAGFNDPNGSISYDTLTRMSAIPQKEWETNTDIKM